MTYEQKKQCSNIFEYYGEKNQLNKATEEAGELIQAIAKYRNEPSEENLNHLAEECADVLIMIQQLKEITGDKVDEFIQQKLNRQLKRIEDEQKKPICSYTDIGCIFCSPGPCEARK